MDCKYCDSELVLAERCDDGLVGGVQYWDDFYVCLTCDETGWDSWSEPVEDDDDKA